MGNTHGRMLSRRSVLGVAASSLIAGAVTRLDGPFVAAHGEERSVGITLPPAMGETKLQVYIPATGHTVSGLFLDYWRANGAAVVYGNPITEPFTAENGLYSQAFERGIFQYQPAFQYTAEPTVRLMPLGFDTVPATADDDDRRDFGHSAVASEFIADVAEEFRSWYDAHGGQFYLGHPVSRPWSRRDALAQDFEGGRLVRDNEVVSVAPLGPDLLARLGLETAPVGRGDLPLFDEMLFYDAPNPNPLGDPLTPGRKLIEVSISEQYLWAHQGNALITSGYVSTGLAPNWTELGVFHLRLKYPTQDMQGFTNTTGEVIGFGEPDGEQKGVEIYDLKDVPDVMYFNMDAEALHGTYWHNNFGTPMSHGCVNCPLELAAFLYGWAPLGTRVIVYE